MVFSRRKLFLLGLTFLVLFTVEIYILISKPNKLGGGQLSQTSNQLAQKNQLFQSQLNDATSSIDDILSQDPSTITADQAVQYVQALAEQKQAQDALSQAAEQQQADAQAQAQQDLISEVQSKGYAGDGSISDYERLFAHPELYGENWKKNADFAYENATDKIATFLQLYQNMK